MASVEPEMQEHNANELTLSDIFLKVGDAIAYLKSKILIIICGAVLGTSLVLAWALLKKTVYTATCTFVLEEPSKVGGLSQYAGLASLAGIDIGGASSGIFSGDNILELYKSRTMIKKTLLGKGNFDGKPQLLIDRYIDYNKLREKWSDKPALKNITFVNDTSKMNRLQDSVITDLVETFNKKLLAVYKPDKKLSIINVSVSTKDELFSKVFTDKLVENVNAFYVQTKTKKSLQSVLILQHQLDSVKSVLNKSITGVASAIDAIPNANPALITLRVPSQKRQVDVQASTAVYAEIVKNLELSKISLRQETPLIQVIDNPVFPLKNDKLGKVKAIAIGLIAGTFLTIIGLLLLRQYQKITTR